jgi:hypothetical protein
MIKDYIIECKRKYMITECIKRWMTHKQRNGRVKRNGKIDGRNGWMGGCTGRWIDGCTCVRVAGWMDVLFVVAVFFFCSNGGVKQMSWKVGKRKKPADFDEREFVAFGLDSRYSSGLAAGRREVTP